MRFVCFFLSVLQVFASHICGCVAYCIHIRIAICSWWIDLFIILKSLSLFKFFLCSDFNFLILVLLLFLLILVYMEYILHSFTFNIIASIYLNFFLCGQLIVGSCFQSVLLIFDISVSRTLTFNTIIDMYALNLPFNFVCFLIYVLYIFSCILVSFLNFFSISF